MRKIGLKFGITLMALVGVMCASPLPASAASKTVIDARVDGAMKTFHKKVSAADGLLARAKGVLVFPQVIKAGIGVGGASGTGALRIGGQSVSYYRTISGSVGFQLGAQERAEVILFMTDEALNKFRTSSGWKAGVDGSVAIATIGTGGEISSETLREPIVGFIFSNKGLMYNLSLEGAKISEIHPE